MELCAFRVKVRPVSPGVLTEEMPRNLPVSNIVAFGNWAIKKNASFCAYRFYRLFIHTFYQSAVVDLPWGKITNSIRTLYTRSFKTTQNSINSFFHSSCTLCVCASVHGIMCKWWPKCAFFLCIHSLIASFACEHREWKPFLGLTCFDVLVLKIHHMINE